jgi:hypothetical protein
MKRLVLPLCLLATAACSSTSRYTPQHLPSQALAWHFDDGLEVYKGGQKIAGQNTWSGLAEAVACVDAARDEAESAHSKSILAKVFVYSGSAVALAGSAGMIGGVAQSEMNETLVLAGGGAAIGGLLSLLVGVLFDAGARPDALDAVNIYNDEYAATPGCLTPPSAP